MKFNSFVKSNLFYVKLNFSDLGIGWKNVLLETEDELEFIKSAMAFFYGHYHGKFLLGGSTNQNVTSQESGIDFSNYLTSDSGIVALNQCTL